MQWTIKDSSKHKWPFLWSSITANSWELKKNRWGITLEHNLANHYERMKKQALTKMSPTHDLLELWSLIVETRVRQVDRVVTPRRSQCVILPWAQVPNRHVKIRNFSELEQVMLRRSASMMRTSWASETWNPNSRSRRQRNQVRRKRRKKNLHPSISSEKLSLLDRSTYRGLKRAGRIDKLRYIGIKSSITFEYSK